MIPTYTKIRNIPLDEWNGHDEIDTGHASGDKTRKLMSAAAAPTVPPYGLYVPFLRQLKLGSIGSDVFALKRALAKSGNGTWGKWGIKNNFLGTTHVTALKSFQKKNNLKVDGIYGKATHEKLAPFYDNYGVWLVAGTKVETKEERERRLIVAAAFLGYQNRDNIHYTQGSLRMQGVRQKLMPPKYPNYEDCSSFSTWTYWTSGHPDPNNLGYNGYGYTGTLYSNGKIVSLSGIKAGDLVFYGVQSPNVPAHVAIYVGEGRVVSHGSEIGPLLLEVTYRKPIVGIRTYF